MLCCRRLSRACLALACCAFSYSLPAHAGKLDDLRERTDYEPYASDDDDDDGDDCNWLQLLLFGCTDDDDAESPQWTGDDSHAVQARQHAALGHDWYFLRHPYAGGRPGNLVRLQLPRYDLVSADCTWSGATCQPSGPVAACVDGHCYRTQDGADAGLPAVARDLTSSRWQLYLDYGRDQDGLSRTGFGFYAGGAGLVGVESGFGYWYEPLPDGRGDGLLLGDVNLHLQYLSLPALQGSVGAGPRFLTDGYGGTAGANVTARFELYPVSPLVFRVEGDVGNLGRAFVWEARGGAGLVWGHLELNAGYTMMRVADLAFDSWFVGLRAHL